MGDPARPRLTRIGLLRGPARRLRRRDGAASAAKRTFVGSELRRPESLRRRAPPTDVRTRPAASAAPPITERGEAAVLQRTHASAQAPRFSASPIHNAAGATPRPTAPTTVTTIPAVRMFFAARSRPRSSSSSDLSSGRRAPRTRRGGATATAPATTARSPRRRAAPAPPPSGCRAAGTTPRRPPRTTASTTFRPRQIDTDLPLDRVNHTAPALAQLVVAPLEA